MWNKLYVLGGFCDGNRTLRTVRTAEADMVKMEQDLVTQEWWTHTKPCFVKYAIDPASEFYHELKPIFYYE